MAAGVYMGEIKTTVRRLRCYSLRCYSLLLCTRPAPLTFETSMLTGLRYVCHLTKHPVRCVPLPQTEGADDRPITIRASGDGPVVLRRLDVLHSGWLIEGLWFTAEDTAGTRCGLFGPRGARAVLASSGELVLEGVHLQDVKIRPGGGKDNPLEIVAKGEVFLRG